MKTEANDEFSAWSILAVLAVSMVLTGCNQDPSHMEQGESMHDHQAVRHESAGGESETPRGYAPGEPMRDEGHAHEKTTTTNVSDSAESSGQVHDGVRTVEVTARKFEFVPAEIVVNEGDEVRLQVTSEDVMHGIGIADFDIDKKLPPGETVSVDFTADKPGTHHFHCTVICGKGHDRMHGELVVLESKN